MPTRALHRASSYGEPTVPRLLASDPGVVSIDVTNQLGQGMTDGCLPGPPPLEVIGGAVEDALVPPRAEGHACAPRQAVVRHRWGPSSSHGRAETTHVVGKVPHAWDAQVAVIRPVGGPTPLTLKRPYGETLLTQ
jgi:hypothetical protein